MNEMKLLKIALQVCSLLAMSCMSAWGANVTIAPATPVVANCYPFGGGSSGWTPSTGYVYQNVPPFSLQTGDILAFDLGSQGNSNIQLQIDMVATTSNGGDIPSGAYTTVVPNTQTPVNPQGDNTIGNYELRFTSQANFNFPGGGLIIRFSNPSAAYLTDSSCAQVTVTADSTDASGYFVKRFYGDADGLPPYANESVSDMGGFQISAGTVVAPKEIPTLSEWGKILLSGLLVLGAIFTLRQRHQ